jgi:hypothetical protein
LLPQSNRLDIDVSFSTAGGVEIEENWDKVKTITIPTADSITGARAESLGLRGVAAACLVGLIHDVNGEQMHHFEQGSPSDAVRVSFNKLLFWCVVTCYNMCYNTMCR